MAASIVTVKQLKSLRKTLNDDFLSVLKFWLKYSIDDECGGYFNCINEDGSIYDKTKHVWLQCRAVWMFSRIYTNPILQNGKYKALRPQIYSAAKHGIDFITKKVIFHDEKTNLYRCYFSIDQNGNGLTIQRKIFSECFFVMALISYSSMIYKVYSKFNDRLDNAMISDYLKEADKYLNLAIDVFKDIQIYIKKPLLLGFKYQPKHIPNDQQFEPLNIPMICLNIIDEFKSLIPPKHEVYQQNIVYLNGLAKGYIANIIKHIDFKNHCLRENVCSNGTFDDKTSDGRMLNPGHAIEATWFLKEYMRKYGDNNKMMINGMNINELTRNIFEWSFKTGWDIDNGGIYAFKDALNGPVIMLESNMKLWWPCNETMISSLLLLKESLICGNDKEQIERDWKMVKLICEYSLRVFSDGNNVRGGWYGYLKENSNIELRIKGGAYKGFFHVPRSLMFSLNILDEIIQNITNRNDDNLQSKL